MDHLGKAGTAYVDVRGDFSRLHRGLSQQTRGMNQHGARWGKALGAGVKLGAGAAVAGAGLIAVGLKKSVGAYAEAEQVGAQTNAVLKSTRREAGLSGKAVAALATEISRKSGVDDEAIQRGENLLLTFTNIRNEAGKGNDIFTRTTGIMADMSVALGQDTKSSAIQLGKALNDPIKGVTALQRVGVSFTADQKDQIKTLVESGKTLDAQKLILRELSKEFGGSAKAAGDTFQGPINKAKVEVGNLGEEVGSVLAPSLKKGTVRFTAFVREMQSGTGAGGRFADDLKQGVKDAEGHVQGLVGRFRQLRGEGESVGGALGEIVSDGFEDAVPKIAESAAEHAPKVASAFVHGFTGANIWGKLAIGGFLLAKFGGRGAFTALGRAGGGAVASGAAAGLTGGGGRIATAVRAMKIGGGAVAGAFIGTQLVGGIIRELSGGRNKKNLGNRIADLVEGGPRTQAPFKPTPLNPLGNQKDTRSGAKKAADDYKQWDAAIRASHASLSKLNAEYRKGAKGDTKRLTDQQVGHLQHLALAVNRLTPSFARMRDGAITNVRDLNDAVKQNMGDIAVRFGSKSKQGQQALNKNFRLAARNVRDMMAEGSISTRRGTKLIAQYMEQNSRAGAKATGASMGIFVGSIKRAIKSGKVTTREGMDYMSRVFVAQMKLFGISGNQARADAKGRAYSIATGNDSASVNSRHGNARGALHQFGRPGGTGSDQIPATIGEQRVVVGSGEVAAVFNGDQIAEANARFADMGGLSGFFTRRNWRKHSTGKTARAFARGGITGRARFAYGGVSGPIAKLIGKLDSMGFRHGSTTGGGHDPGGFHPRGKAVDYGDASNDMQRLWSAVFPKRRGFAELFGPSRVKPGPHLMHHGVGFTNAKLQADHEDHIHLALAAGAGIGGLSAAAVKHIKRQIVSGPDSPLRTVLQGTLDRGRKLANKRIDKLAEKYGGATLDITGGGPAPHVKRYSVGQMAKLWASQGGAKAYATLMGHVGQAESGGNPNARNSIGATGLWQIYNGAGTDPGLVDPQKNARAAIAKFDAARPHPLSPWVSSRAGWSRYVGPLRVARGGLFGNLARGGTDARGPGRDPHAGVKVFNRMWNAARSFFPNAPGHYPGTLIGRDTGFVGWATPAGRNYVQHPNDARGEFLFPQGLLDGLASGGKDTTGWGLDSSTIGKLLVHEFAHSQQDPRVTDSRWKSEGGAEAFAGSHASAIMAKAGLPYDAKRVRASKGDPYRPFMQRVRKTLGQKWVDGTQFGAQAKGAARGLLTGAAKRTAAATGGIWPTQPHGRVIGTPGVGTHSRTEGPNNWQSDNALDIGLPFGSLIRAVRDGEIAKTGGSGNFSGRFGGYNLTLNAAGNEFFYTHLSKLARRSGKVLAGDFIGRSGKANGVPHLHFGVKHGDPMTVLNRRGTNPASRKKRPKHHHNARISKQTRRLAAILTSRASSWWTKRIESLQTLIEDKDKAYPHLSHELDELGAEYLVDHDENADTPDVVNQSGMTIDGKLVPGIDQAVEAMNKQVENRSAQVRTMLDQQVLAKRGVKVFTSGIKRYQKLFERIAAKVRENARRIVSTKNELRTLGKKKHKTAADRKRASRLHDVLKDLHRDQKVLTGDEEPRTTTSALHRADASTVIGGAWASVSGRKEQRAALSEQVHELPFAIRDKRDELDDLAKAIGDAKGTAPPKIKVEASAAAGDSERAGLLEGLLREANLRTQVSERQFEVLRSTPPYGGIFHSGGVVPGPPGAERTIIAQGGERVLTLADQDDLGSGATVVQMNIAPGMEWLERFIDVRVENKTRQQARTGARVLPGRTGVLA